MQNKYNVDLNKLLLKITYIWLAYAIVFPGILLLVAYYIGEGGQAQSTAPIDKEIAFAGLLALSVIQLAVAHFVRNFLLKKPLIVSESSFKEDFAAGVFRNFVIISALTEAVAIYGMVYFLAFERDLRIVMLCAIICVIGFQLFRIREGFLQKALKIQEDHVAAGRFVNSAS